MQKLSNFTGTARQMMTPSMPFGAQRQHHDFVASGPMAAHSKQRGEGPQMAKHKGPLSLAFNMPFSSNLAGPEADDIIHSTPGAFDRWTHPQGTKEGTPTHMLPVHAANEANLRDLCKTLTAESEGKLQAHVTSSEPRIIPGHARLIPAKSLVTNVCLYGDSDLVKRMRGKILNDSPISLKCATVELDQNLVSDPDSKTIRKNVLAHINYIAEWTRTDIFLMKPKKSQGETGNFDGMLDNSLDHRFRVAIYGDSESSEHAKTRALIMVDQILRRHVDCYKLELSMHPLICGRFRKHIRIIEYETHTAIYFPPPFPQQYGYNPPGANRRHHDEVFLTGENETDIFNAKTKIHELVRSTKACLKEVKIATEKIDSMLLERLDKVRRVTDYNGSCVTFPPLGNRRSSVRVQGTDVLTVERTVKELMAISSQFYSASWWTNIVETNQRGPSPSDVKDMLADICISSGAEISFDRTTFHLSGSDDSVKIALWIINTLPFVKKAQSQIKVKIELATEHKEFVSGKKNGKINKIMSQSNVQVVFDLFNEYNFYIDVGANNYDAIKMGLDLVEQEMPASIAFHVPDQYHKRIIGIGGSHIQRIMKKHSVFVKFSNAMDRGGHAKEDDDIKVDNVICRTPARNAQSLELVKQEIMDMVEKADADLVSEPVSVNRLYHRELLARLPVIEELEKGTNCKIIFPSTEEANDEIIVTGPEYQVPQAIDALLGMVPESHEITISTTDELETYFTTVEFQEDVVQKLKEQYEIDLHVNGLSSGIASESVQDSRIESLTMSYTRNNAGGLKDAIEYLTGQLVAHGLDASTVKGTIPRPKSDSFADSLPFFESKVLHRAEPYGFDSPSRPETADGDVERSLLDRIKKPGSISSLSSFLERRRNGNGGKSPTMFMMNGSGNASKASLLSFDSATSGYRNPWNDSAVNLADDDSWPARFSANGEIKYPYGSHPGASASSISVSSGALPPPGTEPTVNEAAMMRSGEATPRHETHLSHDSGRPSTAHSGLSLRERMSVGPPSAPPSA